MGRFIYGSALVVVLDDEPLGYLQAVVGAKFRLQQSFYFSWGYPAKTGESRTTIWLTPAIAMQFAYRSPRPPALDRDRLAALFEQANTPSGLLLTLDP